MTTLATPTARPAPSRGGTDTTGLAWLFAAFSSLRLISYFPTMMSIVASGDSSQHSLWTWGIWIGANLTMAGSLYEQAARRLTIAALVTLANSGMCIATALIVAHHRL